MLSNPNSFRFSLSAFSFNLQFIVDFQLPKFVLSLVRVLLLLLPFDFYVLLLDDRPLLSVYYYTWIYTTTCGYFQKRKKIYFTCNGYGIEKRQCNEFPLHSLENHTRRNISIIQYWMFIYIRKCLQFSIRKYIYFRPSFYEIIFVSYIVIYKMASNCTIYAAVDISISSGFRDRTTRRKKRAKKGCKIVAAYAITMYGLWKNQTRNNLKIYCFRLNTVVHTRSFLPPKIEFMVFVYGGSIHCCCYCCYFAGWTQYVSAKWR